MPKWRNFNRKLRLKWPKRGELGYKIAAPITRPERYTLMYKRIRSDDLADCLESLRANDRQWDWAVMEIVVPIGEANYYLESYSEANGNPSVYMRSLDDLPKYL